MPFCLELDYPLMAYIREILTKEKQRIWWEDLPYLKSNLTSEEISEAYERVIENCRNPWLAQGRCNLILDEIAKYEKKLQQSLRLTKK